MTALCNQPEAFTSDLGDDKSHYLCINNLLCVNWDVKPYIPCDVCAGLSCETVDRLMDFVEKYLMIRLYRFTFCSYLTDDEDRDLAMQTRIRSLHWITSHLLDTAIDECCDGVRDLLDSAITGQ